MIKTPMLVLTELFLPTKGGTAVWFDSVYRIMGGKEIHIVTDIVPGFEKHDQNHPNHIHRLNLRRVPWLKPESLAMYLKLFFFSFRLFCKSEIHFIHAGRVLPEGLVGWILGKIFKKSLVIYAHGEEITTWRQPAKFKVMTYVYKQADCVIANSEFTKNELLKLGVLNSRVKKVSPGVELAHFRPGLKIDDLKLLIGVDKNKKLIFSVGRLTRRKGFDQTIRSISRLNKNGLDVHYAIAGTGEDSEYLESLAKNLGVAENVHFLGHVTEIDLPRWYNAADVFVMPNREINGDTEGFGMVFIEANACGKPVVSGMAGGTGGAVIHGETGFRIDGNSLNELTETIGKLLTDQSLSNQLGKNGLRRARELFSWNSIAEQTKKINQYLRESVK